MYDRATESLWNQFDGKAVIRVLTCETLEPVPSFHLADWKVEEGQRLTSEVPYVVLVRRGAFVVKHGFKRSRNRRFRLIRPGTPAGEPQFAAARAVLARKLARLRLVGEYIESNHDGSPLTHKGGVLKAAQFELSLMASVEKSFTDLGLNPGAAAKLGVELVRGSSIAEELAAARQVRDRADQTHNPTPQASNADNKAHR